METAPLSSSRRGGMFSRLVVLLVCLATVAEAKPVAAAEPAKAPPLSGTWAAWNAPVKPFRIIGNIYYVGAAGVSSYLITSSQGHVLLDTGFQQTVPLIQTNVAKLGFRFEDIRILLSSHAHGDHTGGHARVKELTGAKIYISEADAPLLASGGENDYLPPPRLVYPPAKADRLVRDNEVISLGDNHLMCHLTPGHTKGCTTWTMEVVENGKTCHVVFFGSTTILDSLVNNPAYLNIAEDYAATYRKLKSLPCDVFLAPHGGFFSLAEKAERLERGEKPNPFIDPAGYKKYIGEAETAFRKRLR
ncbi:MAG TPA: subclass B3 metallo-beta-lactamase [Verrucomicrobiae bacterium]|nr:subclass B3 metallo-beta-lactamase [Verrucomicrobiae bacterium]